MLLRAKQIQPKSSRRRRGGIAELFEVELIDATSVGLRNSYEIIIDLNLFAGLR
jgi:hypothetical protein